MPAKFQLRKGSTGKFRFVLLSTNGQVVATSESYERKASALAGIRSVQKNAATAEVEDTTTAQWADAEAARKAAKKAGKKGAAKSTAKKLVSKAASAAPKAAAPKKAAPKAGTTRAATASSEARAASKSGTKTPVRKSPPPLTRPPGDLTPKI